MVGVVEGAWYQGHEKSEFIVSNSCLKQVSWSARLKSLTSKLPARFNQNRLKTIYWQESTKIVFQQPPSNRTRSVAKLLYMRLKLSINYFCGILRRSKVDSCGEYASQSGAEFLKANLNQFGYPQNASKTKAQTWPIIYYTSHYASHPVLTKCHNHETVQYGEDNFPKLAQGRPKIIKLVK